MVSAKTSGVYSITNTVDGKVYIGSGDNIHRRWIAHRTLLRRSCHNNTHLQNAWNRHGEQAFVFAVLEECQREETVVREQTHLDRVFAERPRQEIYNVARCAEAPMRGAKASMLTTLRMSAALKGKKRSAETRARMCLAQRGRKISDEAKRNISVSKSGPNHPMWGKEFSAERKQKISAANKGRQITGQWLENMRAAARSDKRRAKISAVLKGRAFTPEHRANWMAAMRRRQEATLGVE